MSKQITLLQFLEYLRDNIDTNSVGVSKALGICLNIRSIYRNSILRDVPYGDSGLPKLLQGTMQMWPKKSADIYYPVPSGNGCKYAYYAFNLWSKRSKYGKLRRELLNFCIDTLKKELSTKHK